MLHNGILPISDWEFALRVIVALFLGSLIGVERQWRQRIASLRTNALLATGSSLFVMITPLVGDTTSRTQIAAYIVSGIGFLAGGVIFKERMSVSGLNTAATLWCTAAVGVLTGFGFILQAAIGVCAILSANVLLRPVVHLINRQPLDNTEVYSSYEIRAVCKPDVEELVRTHMIDAVRETALNLIAVYSDDLEQIGRCEVVADVTVAGRPDKGLEKIVAQIGREPGVTGVSWKVVPTSDEEREVVAGS